MGLHFPHKIQTDYPTEIVITDSAGVLTEQEKTEMEEAFVRFQDRTGITPAFFSEKDIEGNLERYAYDKYITSFTDEKHWLIVYNDLGDREHWDWEGMIGNDCGGMITSHFEDLFTKRLHKNLEKPDLSVSGAVIDAFDMIGSRARFPSVSFASFSEFFTFVVMSGIMAMGIYMIYSKAKSYFKGDPRIDSYRCSQDEGSPETVTCAHCGGEYVKGFHREKCPYCGAPDIIDEKE